MHKDCLAKNQNITCSYEVYRKEIEEMKISFTRLGHEECEICDSFTKHSPDHNKDNLNHDCEMCMKWKPHITKADESRREYRVDRDSLKAESKSNERVIFQQTYRRS